MAINPISANLASLLNPDALISDKNNPANGGNFADIFNEAINTVSATENQDKASSLALLAGQTDDMAGLLIDSQKAEIALSLALSLRNKVLEAYTEIMRMQV